MHVLITGASAGIGRALAREYAARGARLSIVARRRPLLEELAREVEGEPCVLDQDLQDTDLVPALVERAEQAHGPVDVLVNNAGWQHIERFDRQKWETVDGMLRLNLHTPLRLMHTVLPDMIERRSGTVINVCSAAAVAALQGQSAYCATKSALASASEAIRAELRFTGVHVMTAYPGYISTDLGDTGYERYDVPAYGKLYQPGDATKFARKVVDAADKKKERLVYPLANAVPLLFTNTTRFVLDRLGPPLKEDA